MVVDFLDIKKCIQPLDHKILVPAENERVSIEEQGEYLRIKINSKWPHQSFEIRCPRVSVMLLPIKEVTAENLANYVADVIAEDYDLSLVKVTVWESPMSNATAIRSKKSIIIGSTDWKNITLSV